MEVRRTREAARAEVHRVRADRLQPVGRATQPVRRRQVAPRIREELRRAAPLQPAELSALEGQLQTQARRQLEEPRLQEEVQQWAVRRLRVALRRLAELRLLAEAKPMEGQAAPVVPRQPEVQQAPSGPAVRSLIHSVRRALLHLKASSPASAIGGFGVQPPLRLLPCTPLRLPIAARSFATRRVPALAVQGRARRE